MYNYIENSSIVERKDMTDQILLENGFKEFKPSRFSNEGIETGFQKRYDDKYGKKYFITVYKWKGITHPITKEKFEPSYEYNTQLYKVKSHDAVDLIFHSSWTLQDVEDYVEILFDTGLFDYYEEF